MFFNQTLGHVHVHVCEFNLKFDVAVGERNGTGGGGEGPTVLWFCHHLLSSQVRLQGCHQGN